MEFVEVVSGYFIPKRQSDEVLSDILIKGIHLSGHTHISLNGNKPILVRVPISYLDVFKKLGGFDHEYVTNVYPEISDTIFKMGVSLSDVIVTREMDIEVRLGHIPPNHVIGVFDSKRLGLLENHLLPSEYEVYKRPSFASIPLLIETKDFPLADLIGIYSERDGFHPVRENEQ